MHTLTHTHTLILTCVDVCAYNSSASVKKYKAKHAKEWSTSSLNSAASQQQKQQQQLKIFSVCAAFAKAAATSTSAATATFARIANDANSGTDVAETVFIFHIVPCVGTIRLFWCHCARKYNVWK